MGASPGNKNRLWPVRNLVDLAMQRYKRIFRNIVKARALP
jgi:hypothetical protein